MRKLLRRRHRAGAGLRVTARRGAVLVAFVAALATGATPHARAAESAIRITSPLGRTGLPGTIRIVARVDGPAQSQPLHVQFYVDKLFLSADTDGPPYDALWSDDNPFEARELTVEAEMPSGDMLRDTMLLKPLEVEEATSVSSVSVDAVVFDSPVLLYYAATWGKGKVQVVGQLLRPENYGIAVPTNSSLRKDLSRILLELAADGTYQDLYDRWFTPKTG